MVPTICIAGKIVGRNSRRNVGPSHVFLVGPTIFPASGLLIETIGKISRAY